MKNAFVLAVVVVASLAVTAGCDKPPASSSEAIQRAKTLKTAERQADYLVRQAQAFVKAEDYQEAIKIAHYVLSSVDARSSAATALLEQANVRLAADVQTVIDETKKRAGRPTDTQDSHGGQR